MQIEKSQVTVNSRTPIASLYRIEFFVDSQIAGVAELFLATQIYILKSFYVLPAFRRMGLSKVMLTLLKETCINLPIQALLKPAEEASSLSIDKLLELFSQAGFRVITRNYYGGILTTLPPIKRAKETKPKKPVRGWSNCATRYDRLAWKPKDSENKVRIEKYRSSSGSGVVRDWIIYGGGEYITTRSFHKLSDAKCHAEQQFKRHCDGEKIEVGNAAALGGY